MRKNVLVLLGLALLMCGSALAQQQYSGGVLSDTDLGTSVYHRLYHPNVNLVSPNGEAACPANADFFGFDLATRSCNSKRRTPASGSHGYKAYFEDIANDQMPAGEVRYMVFDAETNQGLANHIGYYFFGGKAVNIGDTMSWNGTNCGGTAASTCLGQGTTTNAAGTAISFVPAGSGDTRVISPIGGFRPIPVPLVMSANRTTGDIVLQWTAASGVNTTPAVLYDVYGLAKDTCVPPTAAEFTTVLRDNFNGVTTTINTQTDFATAPAVAKCYYFAIKLVYPNAGTTAVVSRYFSANSQGATFGGAASTVTDLRAVRAGRGISVSWKTGMEDGLRGFYVTRSFTQNGTFTRVSGLIPAKGQPSTYTFVDTTVPAGRVQGTGVYYKVETADVDNNTQAFGPVKADLGGNQPERRVNPKGSQIKDRIDQRRAH